MALITLDDTVGTITDAAVDFGLNQQPIENCGGETGTTYPHYDAMVAWHETELPDGLNTTNRVAESYLLSIPEIYRGQRMTQTANAVLIVEPELREKMDYDLAYSRTLVTAQSKIGCMMLLAAFDDTLPSEIHYECIKHDRPDLIQGLRDTFPRWVRSWEW